MWLYVPRKYCPSAPGREDLTSASDWRARTLAQSVTWNGKHSRSQTWSRRFKEVSWTKPLFGAILPPSTASHGVAAWIGSLAVSRASLTPQPDSDAALTTNGTSGPTPPESSGKSGQPSSSWRTFQESWGITTSGSGQSYGEWATQLRKDYSRRMKSAPRTLDNGSSSWATSTNRDEKDRGCSQDGRRNKGPALGRDVLNWPTPNTGPQNDEDAKWQDRRALAKEKHGNNGFGLTLGMATSVWPTPRATDGPKAGSPTNDNLPAKVRRWPTPTTAPEAPNTNTTATASTGAYTCGKGNPETPSLKLDGAARKFPTPSVSDIKGFDGPNKASPSKNWEVYSRLARMTSTSGHECSTKCRRLNPLFVERLMGWPGGWTLLPTGLRDFESSVMEWSRWWRLMRSALSQLDWG